MTLAKARFQPYTEAKLSLAKIETYPQLPDLAPAIPEDVEHIVFDIDGVIKPHGGEADKASLQALEEIADNMPYGISLVSSGAQPDFIGTFSVYNPSRFSLKQWPWVIPRAIKKSGAKPENTLGIGDGLSDMLAYRLAGIGRLGLVQSIGLHPLQVPVHTHIYSKGLRTSENLKT